MILLPTATVTFTSKSTANSYIKQKEVTSQRQRLLLTFSVIVYNNIQRNREEVYNKAVDHTRTAADSHHENIVCHTSLNWEPKT